MRINCVFCKKSKIPSCNSACQRCLRRVCNTGVSKCNACSRQICVECSVTEMQTMCARCALINDTICQSIQTEMQLQNNVPYFCV